MHITSGKSARGTELLTLRHMNTWNGHRRSILNENGMVGTVTSYYRGYNVTGTLKIIQRYLPKEVSELLIYYLRLVISFWQYLGVLVYQRKESPSPDRWSNRKLGQRSTRQTGGDYPPRTSNLSIQMYLHIAVAISR